MNLKQRIARGDFLVGAGIYSNSVDVIDAATRDMDWIWWECQHAHADWQTTIHAVRAAYGLKIPVLIRTWTHDPGTIERLLDTGAEGIIVPMVDTAEQARAVVRCCYYPPLGNRSFGSIRAELVEPDLDAWNKRVIVIPQIETPLGIANCDEIVHVPGIDGLLIGARDLSLRRGRLNSELADLEGLAEDVQLLVNSCRNAGKVAAAIALTPKGLAERFRQGFRLVCAGMDVDHLLLAYQGMRRTRDEILKDSEADTIPTR
ncbi:MAG: aldolase/citrate lyase family protein [Planctomycetota bacterium]|nr:aldolase/citrate lyase family protein [Planctomycetota bacterium]